MLNLNYYASMTLADLPLPGSTITAYCDNVFVEGNVLCIDVSKKLIVLRKFNFMF